MIKLAVCSDIGLESRFRRMSSQKIEQYHEDIIKHFHKLIDIILEEKPNFFFIVGNLFGKVKPTNSSLNTVLKCLTRLTEKKIDIFILPGNLETPLFTTNDIHALEIYRNIPRIHVIYDNQFNLQKQNLDIKDAIFNKIIQGIDVKIFSTPNPLIPLHEFTYNLDISGKSFELFLIGDLTAFKKKKDKEKIQESLIKLDENSLTAIFIGGNIPHFLDISQMKNKIVLCPQINANNFDFARTNTLTENTPAKYETGIKFVEYEPINHSFTNMHVIPVSEFEIETLKINLNELEPKLWDEKIKKKIQLNSKVNKFVRLQLDGEITRAKYHKYLSIYRFFDIGRVKNYHFELEDQIIFENAAADISDLKIIDELLTYKNKRVLEIINEETENENHAQIEQIYNLAMQKIKIEYQGEDFE